VCRGGVAEEKAATELRAELKKYSPLPASQVTKLLAGGPSQLKTPPNLAAFVDVCSARWRSILRHQKTAAAAGGHGDSRSSQSSCASSVQTGLAGDVALSELAVCVVEQAGQTAVEQHTVTVDAPLKCQQAKWKKDSATLSQRPDVT
jgi:hypothetical protein